MKRKHIILVMLFVLSGLFTMQSCSKEDNTTFTIKQAFTTPTGETMPAVRADGTILFTGTTVDLKWTSENSGGDPINWTVYFGTGKAPALYQTGVTTNTLTVPVVDGQTYYWKVSTTDARGVITTSPVFKFIAVNGTNPKMSVALTTTTDVLTAIGANLKPDDVVNLRLLIMKKSDMSVFAAVDDAGASESTSLFNKDLPDGEYVIGVDIASTINAGDLNAPINLSFVLDFKQLGLINTSFEYVNVMTNVNSCSLYRTLLANVKKVGPVYTIERAVSNWVDPMADVSLLAGTWQGWDAATSYPSQITSAMVGGKLLFDGIGTQWMGDDWGEVIVTHPAVEFNFNFCEGTITIPRQKIMTTTWKGAAQPAYYIQGDGVFDMSGAYPVMTIHYDFFQGTSAVAPNFGIPYFTAKITLDPGGLKVAGEPLQIPRITR